VFSARPTSAPLLNPASHDPVSRRAVGRLLARSARRWGLRGASCGLAHSCVPSCALWGLCGPLLRVRRAARMAGRGGQAGQHRQRRHGYHDAMWGDVGQASRPNKRLSHKFIEIFMMIRRPTIASAHPPLLPPRPRHIQRRLPWWSSSVAYKTIASPHTSLAMPVGPSTNAPKTDPARHHPRLICTPMHDHGARFAPPSSTPHESHERLVVYLF
jgi:hypothetical protein